MVVMILPPSGTPLNQLSTILHTHLYLTTGRRSPPQSCPPKCRYVFMQCFTQYSWPFPFVSSSQPTLTLSQTAPTFSPTAAPYIPWTNVKVDGTSLNMDMLCISTAAATLLSLPDSQIATNIHLKGPNVWIAMASSYDGQKVLAGVGSEGYLHTSVDQGATWVERTGASYSTWWWAVTSSPDGTNLTACPSFGSIYVSHNSVRILPSV